MHSGTRRFNRRQTEGANRAWIGHPGKLNANPSLECKKSTREPQGENESWRLVTH